MVSTKRFSHISKPFPYAMIFERNEFVEFICINKDSQTPAFFLAFTNCNYDAAGSMMVHINPATITHKNK